MSGEMGMKENHGPPAIPAVLILGTGAMAKLFGGRLARQGLAGVTLAGRWRAAVDSMADEGLVVEDVGLDVGEGPDMGEIEPDPDAATNTRYVARVETRWLGGSSAVSIPADLPAAHYDLVLILVKSHQTRSVAPVAAHAVAPHGRILTLQNGVGNREALAAAAQSPAQVSAGVTTAGATGLGPNRVRAGGPGLTVLGDDAGARGATIDDEKPESISIETIAEMLQAAGFETETSDDIDALLWRKLVVNCAINPLTALHGIPNGALLEDDGLRRQMAEAAREVVAVAGALGVQLGDGFDPVAAAETVAHKTRGNRSSMLQDMDRGARTEIDAICGAVVRAGTRLGVAMPVNARLWSEVRAREEVARSDTDGQHRNRRKRETASAEVSA